MARYWICLLLIILFGAISTYTAALWMRGDGKVWLFWSYLTSEMCCIAWYVGVSGSNPGIARVSIISPMAHLIIGVVIGLVVANTKLTWQLLTAAVLALIAVVLAASEPQA